MPQNTSALAFQLAQSSKPDAKQLSTAFVKQYYAQFSENRAALASLYQDSSMLSFNGFNATGRDQIMNYFLRGLNFRKFNQNIKWVVRCFPAT